MLKYTNVWFCLYLKIYFKISCHKINNLVSNEESKKEIESWIKQKLAW